GRGLRGEGPAPVAAPPRGLADVGEQLPSGQLHDRTDRDRAAVHVPAELGEGLRDLARRDGLAGLRGRDVDRGRGRDLRARTRYGRSEEHTSELQSRFDIVCRLLLEKKKR